MNIGKVPTNKEDKTMYFLWKTFFLGNKNFYHRPSLRSPLADLRWLSDENKTAL